MDFLYLFGFEIKIVGKELKMQPLKMVYMVSKDTLLSLLRYGIY